jgi:ATP-binding cassette subfamily B protein
VLRVADPFRIRLRDGVNAVPGRPRPGAGWALIGSALRPRRRIALLAAGFGLLWAAGKLTVPILLSDAIERGAQHDDRRGVVLLCVAMLLVGAVTAVAAGLRRRGAEGLAYQVEIDLRGRIYAHAQRMHQAFHDVTPTGELMARTANDLQQIRNPLINGPLTIANIAMLLGSGVVLFAIDPVLAVLALTPCVLMMLLARAFTVRLGPASGSLQHELGRVSAVVEEGVGGIRALKGLGLEAGESAKLAAQAQRVYRAGLSTNAIRAVFLPAMELLPALGLVAVLWLGGRRVAEGGMTLGDLVQFSYYLLMLVQPLRSTGTTIAQLQRALVSAGLVGDLLATEPAVIDARDAQPLPSHVAAAGPSRVELHSVSFGYRPGAPVLHDIQLAIEPGESIALVGASGSGKTTLASLVSRTYDVDSGVLRLDGSDIRDLRLADVRRAVSVVFDETFLFEGTIRDNIAFAEPSATRDRVERAARLAGAHDFISALPEGFGTLVGGRGRSLSGGQRQRIALARAILPEPRVLILDDVMSAVDPAREEAMRDALQAVIRERTTILIANRAATIRLAHRVVLLDRGTVAAMGTHTELMASSQRYREVLAGRRAEVLQ